MVACKFLRGYNNNKEIITQFCLEEKRRAKQKQQLLTQGPSYSKTPTQSGDQDLYSHKKLVIMAKGNQNQQTTTEETHTTETQSKHRQTTAKTTTIDPKKTETHNVTK